MSLRILIFIACLGLVGCLGSRNEGGGSETTVAGISGRVVDGAGNPVAGAAIRIRPEDALPPALVGAAAGDEDETAGHSQADGSFLVEDIAPGDYVVEVRDSATAGAALLTARVTAADSLVRLPDAVMMPMGAVRGTVRHPQDSRVQMGEVYVYLPGLTERALARNQDSLMPFLLGNLPAGRYTLRVQAPFPLQLILLRVLEVPNVEVRPGDTVDLGYLDIPLRSGLTDEAYLRDSAVVRAWLDANGNKDDVQFQTMVTGNRITGIHVPSWPVNRITKDLADLDRLESLQLIGGGGEPFDNPRPLLPLEVAPEFARVQGLKRILLWGYAMDSLPDWPLAFPQLAGLHLLRMGMTRFPIRAASLPFLTSLDLTDNRIASIPADIARFKRLRVLDMSGNDLVSLPAEMRSMPGLRGFRARGNRLCDLDAEWMAWLTHQDSLWKLQADSLSDLDPVPDPGWQATQRCDQP